MTKAVVGVVVLDGSGHVDTGPTNELTFRSLESHTCCSEEIFVFPFSTSCLALCFVCCSNFIMAVLEKLSGMLEMGAKVVVVVCVWLLAAISEEKFSVARGAAEVSCFEVRSSYLCFASAPGNLKIAVGIGAKVVSGEAA